jgi:SAM-dependent methyltransferase
MSEASNRSESSTLEASSEIRQTNSCALKTAALQIVRRRVLARGEVDFPCVPSLASTYVGDLLSIWRALGKPFSTDERAALLSGIELALATGFEATPYARMVISYEVAAPPAGVRYAIRLKENTMEQHYEHWLSDRKPPLFGANPDARVMEIAQSLGDPRSNPVLDIGAGTGRNALPLARRGHPTHAVELVPALAGEIAKACAAEQLSIEVTKADALSADFSPRVGNYRFAFLSEVASHFRDAGDLRNIFTKLASALSPGGIALVNLFVAVDGYEPDALAREVSEVSWSRIFTRRELAFATQLLPFELVGDESVHDHEKTHAPAGAWPPTTWFVDWSRGRNVFDLPQGRAPIELRWLTFRRR